MMKRITVLASAAILAMTSLSSCSKDDPETPQPKSKTELLTAKNWRIIADIRTTTTSSGQNTTTDAYATYANCLKDDYMKYLVSNQVETNRGTVKCSSSEAQKQLDTWVFDSNETRLRLTAPSTGFSATYDILELTDDRLRLRITSTSTTGTNSQEVIMASF